MTGIISFYAIIVFASQLGGPSLAAPPVTLPGSSFGNTGQGSFNGSSAPSNASGLSDGYKLDQDGTLSYIVQISNTTATEIATRGEEVRVDIPEYLRGIADNVVIRIGNGPVERELSEEQLRTRQRQRLQNDTRNAGITNLNSLSDRSPGGIVPIDPTRAAPAILPTGNTTSSGRSIDKDLAMAQNPFSSPPSLGSTRAGFSGETLPPATSPGLASGNNTNTLQTFPPNNSMTGNGLQNNGLSSNGLNNNGLVNNGLTNNGLSSNQQTNNGLTAGMNNGLNNGVNSTYADSLNSTRNGVGNGLGSSLNNAYQNGSSLQNTPPSLGSSTTYGSNGSFVGPPAPQYTGGNVTVSGTSVNDRFGNTSYPTSTTSSNPFNTGTFGGGNAYQPTNTLPTNLQPTNSWNGSSANLAQNNLPYGNQNNLSTYGQPAAQYLPGMTPMPSMNNSYGMDPRNTVNAYQPLGQNGFGQNLTNAAYPATTQLSGYPNNAAGTLPASVPYLAQNTYPVRGANGALASPSDDYLSPNARAVRTSTSNAMQLLLIISLVINGYLVWQLSTLFNSYRALQLSKRNDSSYALDV